MVRNEHSEINSDLKGKHLNSNRLLVTSTETDPTFNLDEHACISVLSHYFISDSSPSLGNKISARSRPH